MTEIICSQTEKKDLKQFEGSHVNHFYSEGYRQYELYSQPLYLFSNYNDVWE